ncbi:MAG: FtsX-like permease family protein, partial [Gemmatimonadota bacterium]|nr:FtsX-like permease family protein [Gemmatimonadota bacterium]
LQSTNADVAPTLRDESAGGGRGRLAALRNGLVVVQVAVSVVLLVGAGLFLRSLDASRSIDPGFGHDPTALLEFNAVADRYSEEEGLIFMETLADRVRAIPGVEAVGYIDNLPLNTLSTQDRRVVVPGVDPPAGRDSHSVAFARIDDGYLDAAGIPLVAGRAFDPTDVGRGEPTALASEEFVRRFFPNGNAIGRTITVGDVETRIVGVTADHKVRQIAEDPRAFLFVNHRQTYTSFVTMVARTTGDADRLALDMLTAARALDPEIMVIGSRTMERHVATMFIARQLGAVVIGGFALLALVLATIGLYGVVSYAVSMRAKEVGIRLSLGAETASVVRMLTASGMRLVTFGGVIGLALAAVLARLLSALLYGVPTLDPVTFLSVTGLFLMVALAASWIPARRVTRLDPVSALRSE